ncbi:MAG: hypothetical protein JWN15_867 [Firmicutes bacterium]|nr:hypothetical protein [Bacillota bacterium]
MYTAILLGVFHGINPAMGWLFAVFLAIYRKDRRELFRALVPITVGHAVSVALIVAIVAAARSTLPVLPIRYGAAAVLLLFGVYRLLRWYRHIAWASVNLSRRELAVWSFLGATSHGSGLMLAPLVLDLPGGQNAIAVVLVHSAAMLLTMAGAAVLVHDRFSLARMQKLWVNFDLIWALSLVAAGGLSLLAALSQTHGMSGMHGMHGG